MSDLIEQMRNHVASYKMLSLHRLNCLDLCDALERMKNLLKAASNTVTQQDELLNMHSERIAELDARNEKLEKVLEHSIHVAGGGGDEAIYHLDLAICECRNDCKERT